jgi:hypothetical protein
MADTPEVEAFAQTLVARAAALRMPALFERSRSDALLQVIDRSGVSVIVVESAALSENELEAVLRFRLAQYLAVGFADAQALFEARIEHEPLASVSATDVQLIAGSAHDGEILCTMALRGLPVAADQPMRSRDRQPFPVEQMHGAGIFDRLTELPDVPVARVREMGRYVKNQQLHPLDELRVRAPIEVSLAAPSPTRRRRGCAVTRAGRSFRSPSPSRTWLRTCCRGRMPSSEPWRARDVRPSSSCWRSDEQRRPSGVASSRPGACRCSRRSRFRMRVCRCRLALNFAMAATFSGRWRRSAR